MEKVKNIETNPNGKILNRMRVYSICRGCVDTGRWVTATEEVEIQIKGAAVKHEIRNKRKQIKIYEYKKKHNKVNKLKYNKFRARYDNGQTSI